MNLIFKLALNDLKRDLKRPWTVLLLVSLPLLTSFLMASVFGGKRGESVVPTIKIAVLDNDHDLLSRALRSFPSQGEASQKLSLRFVNDLDEGWSVLENDQASALVVLPVNMTSNLMAKIPNSIDVYENPAQQILPKVVSEGVSILASGLSGAGSILGEPLQEIRNLTLSNSFPADVSVVSVASHTMDQLKGVRTYLFPPIILFTNIPAADYVPVNASEDPSGRNQP